MKHGYLLKAKFTPDVNNSLEFGNAVSPRMQWVKQTWQKKKSNKKTAICLSTTLRIDISLMLLLEE